MGADFSRICAWFVVNREAYDEGLRLLCVLNLYICSMKKFGFVLFFLMLSIGLYAQDSSIEHKFKMGEELYNKKRYKEAISFLTESANADHPGAQYLLGKMYANGNGIEKDYDISYMWLKKSADQGYAKGQMGLGYLYYRGWGVEKDENEALKWYLMAEEQGLVEVKINMGLLYERGQTTPHDYNKAVDYYKFAAEKGETKGMVNLGFMYERGLGVNKDFSMATKWYRRAADLDDALGQWFLGMSYQSGIGVKRDIKEAIKWFTRAADQNEASAQNSLGRLYERGEGVTKSYTKAANWYQKAAELGNSSAQNSLGVLYYNGWGVKKNYDEAAWLFKKAAEQDNPLALFNVGLMYENGTGVTKNISEAIEWYKKALKLLPNYEQAKNALARLGVSESDEAQQTPTNTTTQPTTKEDDMPIDISGTGFLIDKRGYLATNNHVTKGAKGIFVCLNIDGVWKSYNAVLVKSDPTNDLSIIRIEDSEFKQFPSLPYNFTTEVEEVASDIYTLGYPQVHIMGTEVKYTTGAINSKSGVQGDPTHYQISAHIDHGNSGGPMFNSKGTIIGITDSGLDKAEFGDVNYAIKSSYLKSLVDALPVKLELPHDTSIEKLSRVEQIKVLSKFTALILIDLP